MLYGEIIHHFYTRGQYYARKNQAEEKHLNDVGIWTLAEGIVYSRMADGCLSEGERIPARDAFINGYRSIPVNRDASILHLVKDLDFLDSL